MESNVAEWHLLLDNFIPLLDALWDVDEVAFGRLCYLVSPHITAVVKHTAAYREPMVCETMRPICWLRRALEQIQANPGGGGGDDPISLGDLASLQAPDVFTALKRDRLIHFHLDTGILPIATLFSKLAVALTIVSNDQLQVIAYFDAIRVLRDKFPSSVLFNTQFECMIVGKPTICLMDMRASYGKLAEFDNETLRIRLLRRSIVLYIN